jgi:hypothetical protein
MNETTVTIKHKPSGKVKKFGHPREACAFLLEYKSKKLNEADIEIDNKSGIALSVYNPRIPLDAQELIERLETKFGGNIVPKWHWIVKPMSYGYATGHTYYFNRIEQSLNTKTRSTCKRISISSNNYNPNDYLGVIIHEFAHALEGPDANHGRRFYRRLFSLLFNKEILPVEILKEVAQHTCAREFRYKKSSRYWYAEMFNIESILSEYRRPEKAAATRLTKEQKAEIAAKEMFEGVE